MLSTFVSQRVVALSLLFVAAQQARPVRGQPDPLTPRSIDVRNAILDRVESALPTIRAHAAYAEVHGRLHEEAVNALVQAGVPRLFLPTSLGGFAADPTTCALACEAIANADSAAGWHVMVYNAARLMAAQWPAELVAHLWQDDPDTMVAASGHTPLKGERRRGPDGDRYIVHGQNGFVSGAHHARYMMAMMMAEGAMHVVILPTAQCQIVDNWDTLGMRGSGSNDVLVDSVAVDARFVVPATEPDTPKNSYYAQDELYRCPSRVVFATYIPVALSLVGRALVELKRLALNKVPYASDRKLAGRSVAQQHYGQALAIHRSAKTYFYDALEEVWARARAGDSFSRYDRADLYLAGTHTMQSCAQAMKHIADAAGTNVLRRGEPLERICRDMETLRHHGFANESRYGSVAQVHWDAELDYPQLLR